IKVYDDFAHHPTAVELTLGGLRAKVGGERILAVLEPRSNTMKLGVHKQDLAPALQAADEVYIFQPDTIPWSVEEIASACSQPATTDSDLVALVEKITESAKPGDNILVMSNGGFGGIHDKLLAALAEKSE
ncbi:glutamate ligase domain-containing protein, partial [Photobacterium sp. OFAV2-7]|uniref:glutamate ligase domain-containing protein n=1 Tax=Photobacterium sp. OFAV2-7 TaxID=2917748 RepID=UPI00272AF157